MRLQHLVLQGYKSFATKTEFPLPAGITAIVGPNGSGKSNVADAIRWVLGEQRMRALRGRTTEDMIFAGGRRRARAGMAEVSLTLDNSDGHLPIEYGEVTIARRAYRSGDNEYLINGARVRLRDINDLLAESGLGERTYTVIGQGLVDAALSLRAQERRTLFEDAAGIALYRSRREEALGRLEETQHNLDRVRDIIAEIAPRLKRLQREAQQVEEHRRQAAHLERLQATWYGYHWGRRQEALALELERAAALESALEERRRETVEEAERLRKSRQQEDELRNRLRGLHAQSSDLYAAAGDVQRELAVAEERSRLLATRREELAAELAPLATQYEAQSQTVDEVKAQVARMEADLEGRREDLLQEEQKWQAAAQVEEPAEERSRLEQDLRAARDALSGLDEALLERRADAARLAGQLEALERMESSGLTPEGAVQAVVQSNLWGIVGPLAGLVDLPAAWRPALETGLAQELQAVVVEKASLVDEVRKIIETSGGRVTLLPLDSLRRPPPLPERVQRASDVVTCDERVRVAVEAVLGAVALCDDVAQAQALSGDLPAGTRCLARDGTVVGADGALSLGRRPDAEAPPMEDTAQAISSRLERVRAQCQDLEGQRGAQAETVSALAAELERLTQEATRVAEEAARAERDTLGKARTGVAVAQEALRSSEAALARETGLLSTTSTQISARRDRAAELEAEQAAVAARLEELRQRYSEMDAQLSDARARIQPAEEKLAEMRSRQIELERKERAAHDKVREAEARHGRAQLEVARREDELKLLARRIEEDLGLVEMELAEAVTAQTPLPLHPVVSQLPVVEELPDGIEEEMHLLRGRLHRLGMINPNAPEEHAEVLERHRFLSEQADDLASASTQLRQVVVELDGLMETAFKETFDAVAGRFSELFTSLFNGGSARLELTDSADLMNTGVDIVAQPPGKRAQRLALLSGGERALTAAALLFALLHVSPTPFCVLDEVDAMLDEANVGRFRGVLEELAQRTQFIVITHNRTTVEAAETIYGVSMGADGVSQVVSLQLEKE
jgi:chromosome segregation protein